MKRSPFRSIGIYIIILLVIWGAWSYVSSKGAITGNYSYDQFKTALQKEEVDMDQMREKVAEYIEQHEVCNFRELLLGQATKMQVIIAFLIILEMMKEGVITIVQIHIAKNKTDESGS